LDYKQWYVCVAGISLIRASADASKTLTHYGGWTAESFLSLSIQAVISAKITIVLAREFFSENKKGLVSSLFCICLYYLVFLQNCLYIIFEQQRHTLTEAESVLLDGLVSSVREETDAVFLIQHLAYVLTHPEMKMEMDSPGARLPA
jgi:hypothetical protein